MTIMDKHEFELLDEVWAPDMVVHLAGSDFERDQVEGFVKMFYEGFPDLQHSIEELIAVGDRVILRAMNRATHSAEFQGVTATGRSIRFGQIAIYRVTDGRIAEIWEEADLLGLWQHLGVEIPGS